MMAITPAAIAAAGNSLILGTANPFNLGLAVLGSQLPDLDASTSLIRNLAGGGDMQRDRLAIADLEVKGATLEAARAELERQREQEKILLFD